ADRREWQGEDGAPIADEESEQGALGEDVAGAPGGATPQAGLEYRPRPSHRLPEPLLAEWLQDVIERSELEGGHREAVVGGGEDDRRRVPCVAERLQPP